ncbi:MAG: RimK/LysX family protein [Pseudomonadota bacterium]
MKTKHDDLAGYLVSIALAFIAASSPALAQDDRDESSAKVSDEGEQQEPDIEEPIALGYLENVRIGNLGLALKGKLDTGADTSSIHARDVEVYKRSPRDNWVRFRLVGKGGRSIRYDQNVIRFAQIKTKRGGTIRRPVIRLPICVGGVAANAEINLADRADFEYDVLIGREFLANRIIVDAGQKYAAEADCETDKDE